MFNYESEQIFIVQPRNTGGGILALLLSLDSNTADVSFKKRSLSQKLCAWSDFVKGNPANAHVHGFNNFGHTLHESHMLAADDCARYVHKHHFYEIFGAGEKKLNPTLEKMPRKRSIGLYLTESCVERLLWLRPQTPAIDYYQLWVYANQAKLLKDFFDITCLHWFSFSDMLDLDILMDHMAYCKDLLELDTDLDVYRQIIGQWHQLLKIE